MLQMHGVSLFVGQFVGFIVKQLEKWHGIRENKRMSYPRIYRERTIEYGQAVHTLEETSKAFKVSTAAIRQWEKQ